MDQDTLSQQMVLPGTFKGCKPCPDLATVYSSLEEPLQMVDTRNLRVFQSKPIDGSCEEPNSAVLLRTLGSTKNLSNGCTWNRVRFLMRTITWLQDGSYGSSLNPLTGCKLDPWVLCWIHIWVTRRIHRLLVESIFGLQQLLHSSICIHGILIQHQ